MKNKILSILLTVTVVLSMGAVSVNAEERRCEGDFCCELKEDGTAELVNYHGNAKDIVIPEQIAGVTVTALHQNIFEEDDWIETVSIPETVTSIGRNAFSECKSLKSVNIPNGITVIESDLFYECENLKSVNIPQGVTAIEIGAFENCKSLESIELPEGLKSIEHYAFSGCDKLQTISIPASVTEMKSAFGFSGVQDIYVAEENSVYASEDGVVYDKEKSTLKMVPSGRGGEFVVPETVIAIGDGAFEACDKLESVVVSEGVMEIGQYAFNGCYGLKSVSLPNTLTIIKSYAFRYCTSLEFISIPDSVTAIGGDSFLHCQSLTEVKLPKGITEIPAGMFDGCTSLKNFVIPETVTTVGGSVFESCISLESVVLPKGLTEIPSRLFRDCIQLHSVTIPKSVKKIGKWAFDECEMLTDVYYGGSKKAWKKIKKAKKNEALNNAFLLNNTKVSVQLQENELRYTGKKMKPEVIVRDKRGAVVTADSYKVSYKNNKKTGIATVTVKGNEIGTQTAHFRICPKPTKVLKVIEKKNGISVKWKKQPVQTDGYEIWYSEDEKILRNGDIATVNNRNKNSVFIKIKSKYGVPSDYIKIRTYKNAKINGKTVRVYSDWSDIKLIVRK